MGGNVTASIFRREHFFAELDERWSKLAVAGSYEGLSTKWSKGEWLREWMRFEHEATEATEREGGGTDFAGGRKTDEAGIFF
jgi:hypothetical protein